MKGHFIAIDHVKNVKAAARVHDGLLVDLIFDTSASARPAPQSIYRARALRPLKGQGGVIVDLGGNMRGYLRNAKGVKEGEILLVQISTYADAEKASPCSLKVIFKSRYVIITPHNLGVNIARSIHDEARIVELKDITHDILGDDSAKFGVILRSSSKDAEEDALINDITSMLTIAQDVMNDTSKEPHLLLAAPDVEEYAWSHWTDPMPDKVETSKGCFNYLGIAEQIDALSTPHIPLKHGGTMIIEPTSALIAVDVNTKGDTSLAAGLKANIDAFRDLPRQLRLRGLGGQITIDAAPYPKKDRKILEQILRASLKADIIETAYAGVTPLGHFELQRKRERLPLASHVKV